MTLPLHDGRPFAQTAPAWRLCAGPGNLSDPVTTVLQTPGHFSQRPHFTPLKRRRQFVRIRGCPSEEVMPPTISCQLRCSQGSAPNWQLNCAANVREAVQGGVRALSALSELRACVLTGPVPAATEPAIARSALERSAAHQLLAENVSTVQGPALGRMRHACASRAMSGQLCTRPFRRFLRAQLLQEEPRFRTEVEQQVHACTGESLHHGPTFRPVAHRITTHTCNASALAPHRAIRALVLTGIRKRQALRS